MGPEQVGPVAVGRPPHRANISAAGENANKLWSLGVTCQYDPVRLRIICELYNILLVELQKR